MIQDAEKETRHSTNKSNKDQFDIITIAMPLFSHSLVLK